MKNHAKRTFALCAAATLLLGGAALPAQAAHLPARAQARIENTLDRHVTVIIEMVGALPAQYADFTEADQLLFTRTKELMDELTRDEMFALLDRSEQTFDRYNDLYRQEKLSGL